MNNDILCVKKIEPAYTNTFIFFPHLCCSQSDGGIHFSWLFYIYINYSFYKYFTGSTASKSIYIGLSTLRSRLFVFLLLFFFFYNKYCLVQLFTDQHRISVQ